MKKWIDGVHLDLKVWRAKDKEPEGGDDEGDWVRDFFAQLDLQCGSALQFSHICTYIFHLRPALGG